MITFIQQSVISISCQRIMILTMIHHPIDAGILTIPSFKETSSLTNIMFE